MSAVQRAPNASIGTFARSVEGLIELMSAVSPRREALEPHAKRPCYMRGLLWDNVDDVLSATAQYLLTAAPVPHVPIEVSTNETLMNTIHSNPHLFKVDCKINIDHFSELIKSHPNQALLCPSVMPSTKVFGCLRMLNLRSIQTLGISLTVLPNWMNTRFSWKVKWRLRSISGDILKLLDLTFYWVCTPPQSMQSPNPAQMPFI
jgi:hypothetical protein